MSKQKMAPEEWAMKADYEGLVYALMEYGLSHKDLDKHADPELYAAAKEAVKAMEKAAPSLRKLQSILNRYV